MAEVTIEKALEVAERIATLKQSGTKPTRPDHERDSVACHFVHNFMNQLYFEMENEPARLFIDRVIERRSEMGELEYGEPLTTFNGRDHIVDAIQEGVDYCKYIYGGYLEARNQEGKTVFAKRLYQNLIKQIKLLTDLVNLYLEFLDEKE